MSSDKGREAGTNPQIGDLKRRLDDLTRLVSDWVWETGPDFRLITVSSRVVEVLGYHPLELVGRRLTDVGTFMELNGRPKEMEWRSPFRDVPFEARTRDGQTRFFLISGLPIFSNRTGSFQGVRGTARDVTQQREAEARLRDSETRYRAVVEDQQEIICRYLPDGTLTFLNQAACRFLKREKTELVGSRLQNQVIEEDRHQIDESLQALKDGDSVDLVEFRIQPEEADLFWLQWTSRPIKSPDGRLVEVQAVGRDVTRRRQAEAVSERLAAAIEGLSDLFALYDRNDRLVLANRRFRDLHATAPEAVRPGVSFNDQLKAIVDARLIPEAINDFGVWIAGRHARRAGPGGAFEVHYAGNQWFLFQEQRMPDGTMVSYGTDISALKQAQMKLAESEERHRAFAADAAHELRTPLAVLRTQLDVLEDDSAKSLREDVDAMARMVEQLLAATRLESGKLEMQDGVDLARLCTDIAVRIAPLAIKEGRMIEVLGAEEPILMRANAIALEQAVRNLLENAIRYSARNTTITITVGPGPQVAVRDRGEGISPEKKDVIFKRFTRADRRSGGAGLGLTIVKRAVEAHDGRVRVLDGDPSDGGGAIFLIDLRSRGR
ncbi:MAG: PAS domain S-box protein [Magnetovibrionaceae bacterium]